MKMALNVKVMESTMVRPASETPLHSLWLSNVDLVMTSVHTPTVYIYKPTTTTTANPLDVAVVVKEALSKALVPFYPLAGRLINREANDENGNKGRVEVDCNAVGALFVVANSTSTIDDLGELAPNSDIGKELLPAVDYSGGISSYPLLLAQITLLKCGGVSLGVKLDHLLADGFSALHFINSWSDLARGVDDIAIPPVIDRTCLRARDPPRILPNHQHDIIYYRSPSQNGNTKTVASVFPFTREQLGILKAKSSSAVIKYTSYEAFAGHVWRCACKARELDTNQETRFYFAVNGRTRLKQPSIPAGYLGNVVFTTAAFSLAGDIILEPLSYAAGCIHNAVVLMDDEYIRSALDFLEVENRLHEDMSLFAHGDTGFTCPDLAMTSWLTMPVYDADFGWGRPIFMGRAAIPTEGKAYMIPSAANDGSFSLCINLEVKTMELFSKLVYDF